MACSGASEHALLSQFFSASRLRDLTALDKIATTRLEPREQGTVLDFEVTRVQVTATGQKEVTASALMRLPTGEIVKRTLVVTLQQRQDGPWVVTAVR